MTKLATKGKTSQRSKKKEVLDEPPMYKVVLLNDHYTTMDFVVSILQTVFRKTSDEAGRIMLDVHNNGSAVAGIYTKEVAETKLELVHYLARSNDFPLRCRMESV